MLINTIKSTFIYDGGNEFDLINPPDQSNYALYIEYNKFINSIVAIYGNQRSTENIPVFWTKQVNNDNLSRIADPDSTLKTLIPGKSYYVLCLNKSVLPLKIPSIDNTNEFLKIDHLEESDSIIPSSCNNIIPTSTSYRSVQLTKQSGSVYPLNISLSGLIPDHAYSFTIDPIYSNWPLTLSKFSGTLERNGPIDSNKLISSSIKSILSYESCEDINECTGNIPYSLIDTNNNYYYKNIFSVFNVNLYDANSGIIFQDSVNISCDECIDIIDFKLGEPSVPTIKIDTSNILLSDNNHIKITATYNNINPFENYTYNFFSYGSNWPSRIRNVSGSIVPEKIYVNGSEQVRASGKIDAIFTFSPTYNVSDTQWSNLNYVLDDYVEETFVKNNIYTMLGLSITNSSSGKESVASTYIRCVNCLPDPPTCISGLSLNMNDTNIFYPELTGIARPGSEITLERSCCGSDRYVYVNINNACCEKVYNYSFTSNPSIVIAPQSGQFSFGDGSGTISCLVNLNNRPASAIQCTVYDQETDTTTTDSMILRCKPVTITVGGSDSVGRKVNGKYYLSNIKDSNNKNFWSQDGLNSYPRIFASLTGNNYLWHMASGEPVLGGTASNFAVAYAPDLTYPEFPVARVWSAYGSNFIGNGINTSSDIK